MNNSLVSTRNSKEKVSIYQAIKQGLASDGGLFVDPNLTNKQVNLKTTVKLDYKPLAKLILKTLMPDFDHRALQESIEAAYHNSFDTHDITPLKKLHHFYLLELFHGPTSAFKDVGLQLLPQLMRRIIKPKQKIMVLTATSGDTGTAALQGFKNVPQIGINVFYPHNGVSPIQYRQMATTIGKNTRVAGIVGNFDDAQTNVKRIFDNQNYRKSLAKKNIMLSSANSINIGRLYPQVVYYFAAYNQLVQQKEIKLGDQINFTVPTGNFGDILAGYYAKQLGLPIKKLIIASNANSVLSQFFKHGIYNRKLPFKKTYAPSMDIQVSSNFERLLYYESQKNTAEVKDLMHQLVQDGHYQVSSTLLKHIKKDFAAGFTNNDQILESIQQVFHDSQMVIDPHTAAGYHVMREYQQRDPDTPMVLLSTASPYKFSDAVAKALLRQEFTSPIKATQAILRATGAPIPKNLSRLWKLPQRDADIISKDKMLNYINHNLERIF